MSTQYRHDMSPSPPHLQHLRISNFSWKSTFTLAT